MFVVTPKQGLWNSKKKKQELEQSKTKYDRNITYRLVFDCGDEGIEDWSQSKLKG